MALALSVRLPWWNHHSPEQMPFTEILASLSQTVLEEWVIIYENPLWMNEWELRIGHCRFVGNRAPEKASKLPTLQSRAESNYIHQRVRTCGELSDTDYIFLRGVSRYYEVVYFKNNKQTLTGM